MNKSVNNKLTEKDIKKFSRRYWITSQANQNYETMQSMAVIYAMGPALEKIYGDNPELLKEKFKAHFQFFNCQTYFGAAITAAALAIEETQAENSSEMATAIKTSMMGPFAGIGDALFNTLPKVVFAALSAYAAIEGSWVTGAVLMLVVSPAMYLIRTQLVKLGYYQGTKLVTERQNQLNILREVISVLGIIVVGALIATTVSISTPLVITVGESSQSIQEILDSILPKLLSIGAVVGVYFGLDIKKMNTVRMVWLLIGITILLSYFGIIA